MAAQTQAEKIMTHNIEYPVSTGTIVDAKIDLAWGCEMTVLWAFDELKKGGFLEGEYDEMLRENGPKTKLFFDHFILPIPSNLKPKFDYVVEQAKKYGIEVFEPGKGIQHRLVESTGMLVPGYVAAGADSHSTNGGAVGALSTGVGSTDLAVTMLKGELPLKVPESALIYLVGEFKKGVTGKDLALFLTGLLGESGANYLSLEFAGHGVKSIPMHHRFTPSNMAVEVGAKTGLFPVDEETIEYLKRQKKRHPLRSKFNEKDIDFYLSLKPDDDAKYAFRIEVDLGMIPPMASFPYSPSNALGIPWAEYALKHWDEMPDSVKKSLEAVVEGHDAPENAWPIKLKGVYWGGCTNGRADDYREVAEKLAGKKYAPINVIINPASQEDMEDLETTGTWKAFQEAGAKTEGCKCGQCFGASAEWAEPGVYAQVTNRNFKGRFGKGVKVILVSGPTGQASAEAGHLASLVALDELYQTEAYLETSIHDYARRAEAVAAAVHNARHCSKIESYDQPPLGQGFDTWVFGDDINTDQIMNAQACKIEDPAEAMKFLLSDGGNEDFREYYSQHGYNLSSATIVGRHNFGCGSSRENAVDAVRRAKANGIVAGSFARIYWRNMINLGVTPYEIGDAVTDIAQGDKLVLDKKNMIVYNSTKGHLYRAKPLPELAQTILNAGGVMEHIKLNSDR